MPCKRFSLRSSKKVCSLHKKSILLKYKSSTLSFLPLLLPHPLPPTCYNQGRTLCRPVTSPISGGGGVQLLTKVRTKKKRSSPIKSGVSEKISIFPVVPPWLHFDFASPAAREPKILAIFVGSRRRRERKLAVLSKISRRTLVYVLKLVRRGGGNIEKKCKNTPKM